MFKIGDDWVGGTINSDRSSGCAEGGGTELTEA